MALKLLYILVLSVTVTYIECKRSSGIRISSRPISRPTISRPTISRPTIPRLTIPTIPRLTIPRLTIPTMPRPTISKPSVLHTYPTTNKKMLSGLGRTKDSPLLQKPSAPLPEHTYPADPNILSGLGRGKGSPHTYPADPRKLSGTGNRRDYSSPIIPYRRTPEYVHVEHYRHSNSCYGDLLAGLSLYNLGRSHNHYNNHYYYDDDYTRRYISSDSSYTKPIDEAKCVLKIKENSNTQLLKIPCEIVSTFTEGSQKVAPISENQLNKTTCSTYKTMVYDTPINNSSVNTTERNNATKRLTVVNTTKCIVSSPMDPMSVKGPPLNANNMECSVEIHTKDSILKNNIDCNTLVSYAKKTEPTDVSGIVPSRSKLKSWLSNPPWWMSMFIAV